MKDNDIIEGLKIGNSETINYVYKSYKTIARSISNKYNFNSLDIEQDINDIFQETMYALIKMINKDGFVLTCKFSTLFYSINKIQTLKHYRNTIKINKEVEVDFSQIVDNVSSFDKESVDFLKICLNKLPKNRKNILEMYYIEGYSMQEISDKLSMGGSDSVKTQKYKAMKKLESIIKTNFTKDDIFA